MANRGIRRLLGESNLERKIRIMFGICLLGLIGGSFWYVNYITEQLINRNTREQANGLISDHMFRSHFKNIQGFGQKTQLNMSASELFSLFANQESSIPYQAEVVVLDDSFSRHQIRPRLATDPVEIDYLKQIENRTIQLQKHENSLHADVVLG
ncbi:MAG: hypothetical protein AAF623_19490, partial [Planctomycetota bacterium]